MAMDKDGLFLKFGADSPHLKVNIFNNYRIIGLLEQVAFETTKGCIYILNYNHTNNQYYLFKKFVSGKIHIDFFKSENNTPKGVLFQSKFCFDSIFIKDNLIAKSIGNDVKTLYFDPITDQYYAKWKANNVDYSLQFSHRGGPLGV
jgi:hypothetical protein